MKPTKPGVYLYRRHGRSRLCIARVTMGRDGKLYATILKHDGWKRPSVYRVGCMGGTWAGRLVRSSSPNGA